MRGLPIAVKLALEKARDSALLAVEFYNKPAVKFKSDGYIVMMVIAWTAVMHAFFLKKKVRPIHKKDGSKRYERIGNDYKYWELSQCLKEYYGADSENPVRKNLEFFVELRNKIEHKSVPEIDPDIFGECQAMLLNFIEFVNLNFGSKYSIREALSFSLQMFPETKNFTEAAKRAEIKDVKRFIGDFRSSLAATVTNSGQFAFKAFLIQVGNHDSKDALAIQFVAYNALSDAEKENLERFAFFKKDKIVPIANFDKIKPAEAVKRVNEKLKAINAGKFQMHQFSNFWKDHNIRPNTKDPHPEKTNSEYCIYDYPNKSYLYTEKIVDFIVEETVKKLPK